MSLADSHSYTSPHQAILSHDPKCGSAQVRDRGLPTAPPPGAPQGLDPMVGTAIHLYPFARSFDSAQPSGEAVATPLAQRGIAVAGRDAHFCQDVAPSLHLHMVGGKKTLAAVSSQ
jgi:hypothetical protein